MNLSYFALLTVGIGKIIPLLETVTQKAGDLDEPLQNSVLKTK